MKEDIKCDLYLIRPDLYNWFYLKRKWPKEGMGEILLQADEDTASIKSEAVDDKGDTCVFDTLLVNK